MTLTILFVHEGEVMRLIVTYLPALDGSMQEGIWDREQNRVAMSWNLFKEFKAERDINKRRKMLEAIPNFQFQAKENNALK